MNTARTASARPANRRSQPRTVSAGRPSSAGDPPMPAPRPPSPTNAAPITSAASARRPATSPATTHASARTRGTAPAAARPAPRPSGAAHHPGPSMTPTGQHPRTPRTRQPTRPQPLLDRGRVDLYREHRRLRAPPHGPPGQLGQGRPGGPWPTPTRRSSRWRRRRTRSTRLAHSPAHPHAQRRQPALRRHPRRRSTHDGTTLFDLGKVSVTRYRYRGKEFPPLGR